MKKESRLSAVFLTNDELLKLEDLFAEGDLQGIVEVFDNAMQEYQNEAPDCDACERILPEDCAEHYGSGRYDAYE
jgi:hypothetical protein